MIAVTFLVLVAFPAAALTARTGPIAVVEVVAPDRAAVDTLVAAGYDVDAVHGLTVTLYATQDELAQLRTLGYPVTVTGMQPLPLKSLTGYTTYSALTTDLQAYANAYPDRCRLISLGQTVQGRELWALLITDHPDIEEDEPEVRLVSTLHGDEPVGTELCLNLIDRLLTDYGADPRVTHLVDETALWIVPLANPDGNALGTRYNAGGYDLNRSFPAYPQDYAGTLFGGEAMDDTGRPPEVQALMRWSAENSFTLSANFHTGSLVVNYPYDDDGLGAVDSPTPDDLLFEDIALRYASQNPPMSASVEFPNGITNGAAWYVVDGGLQDWSYRYLSCNAVTIELSDIKAPAASTLPQLWQDNEESMLRYVESAQIGVRGKVLDSTTGQPVYAQVTVAGNAHPVYTDPDVGDYHRMLLPGTYTLTISAPGYFARTFQGVHVKSDSAVRLDTPLANPDVDGDGMLMAADLQQVINAVLGYNVPYDCDVDGGGVTATDVQKLIWALLHPTEMATSGG